jgi:hypothetical protein
MIPGLTISIASQNRSQPQTRTFFLSTAVPTDRDLNIIVLPIPAKVKQNGGIDAILNVKIDSIL